MDDKLIGVTEYNCIAVCKELWAWLEKHYGKSHDEYSIGELKEQWPGWKKYETTSFLCPLCEVYNDTASFTCDDCPLQGNADFEGYGEQGCYTQGYADVMTGIAISKFNEKIQALE